MNLKQLIDTANTKIETAVLRSKLISRVTQNIESKRDWCFIWLDKAGIYKKKEALLPFEAELSNFIQEFLINYGAGITLEKALKLTLSTQCRDDLLHRQIAVSSSAVQALNQYATLQDRKEIWRFVRLINQFHITGSLSTIAALEKYHDELWQMKLIRVRKKSESITIQLTFLLMLSLISVIIVVLTPIIMIL
jgi:hypothetical protein